MRLLSTVRMAANGSAAGWTTHREDVANSIYVLTRREQEFTLPPTYVSRSERQNLEAMKKNLYNI